MLLGSGSINSDDVQIDLSKQLKPPERHPTPLGTTTVPPLPYTSALGVPGERIAADAHLGEREARRGAVWRTHRSLPPNG